MAKIPECLHWRNRLLQDRRLISILSGLALFIGPVRISAGSVQAQDAVATAAFAKCLACHETGPGARNGVGPVLNGIIGKPAGSAAGFSYSDAFVTAKSAGLVWTEDTLDKYLAGPIGFMPGSRMAWAVPDAAERRAIVAYLLTLK